MKTLVKYTIQLFLIVSLVSCSPEKKESMYEACLRVEISELAKSFDPYTIPARDLCRKYKQFEGRAWICGSLELPTSYDRSVEFVKSFWGAVERVRELPQAKVEEWSEEYAFWLQENREPEPNTEEYYEWLPRRSEAISSFKHNEVTTAFNYLHGHSWHIPNNQWGKTYLYDGLKVISEPRGGGVISKLVPNDQKSAVEIAFPELTNSYRLSFLQPASIQKIEAEVSYEARRICNKRGLYARLNKS